MSDVLISNFLTPNSPDENTAAISDLKISISTTIS